MELAVASREGRRLASEWRLFAGRCLVYCVIVALFGCSSPGPMPQRLSIPPLPLTFLTGLTMQESRVTIDAQEKAGGQWDIRVEGTRMHPGELQEWTRQIATSYFGIPRKEAGLPRRLRIRIDAEVDPYVTGIREVRLVTASELHLVVGIPDPKRFSGVDLPLYPPAR